MTLFSIIVPIYNVEAYLKECLDSILNQTFKDFELILVNDGSTDSSGKIADEYGTKHKNIKVIHKENGGLSSSRNTGVNNSNGKYLLFVDSDDLLANKNALSNIVTCIDDNEVILLGFEKLFRDKTTKPIINNANEDLLTKNIDEKILGLIKSNIFVSSACNKCISKPFFMENNLFFRDGILSEDVDWSVRLLLNVNKLTFTNKPFYYYRQTREGSISTTVSKKHISDFVESVNLSLKYIYDNKVELGRKGPVLDFLAYQYMVLMSYYVEADDRNLKKEIKKLEFLLNYDLYKKVKIINIVRKIFGYNLTAYLMNKFVRNRK